MTLDGGEHGAGTAPGVRLSAAELEALIAQSTDVFFRSSPDSVIEWISPSVLEVLGAPPAEIIGSRMFERVHPDDRPMVLAKSSDLNSGGSVQHRSRFRTADGSYRWLDVVVDPIVSDGVVVARIGRARDVDDEVRALQALEASEDRYRRLATHAADVVFRSSQAGEMVWISDAVTLLLGWRPDELTDRPFIEFVHPEDRDRFRSLQARLGLGEPSNLEFRVRTAEGGYKWVAAVVRPEFDDQGRLTGRSGGWRDVDAEMQTREALRRSEKMFRTAMEHSAVGMALVAPDGAFMEANRALCQMLGRGPEDLKSTSWQQLTHPDDVAVDQHLVDEVLNGVREGYRLRKRYLRPDGKLVWGDLSVSCVRNDDGTVRHFISQILDVTEQERTREALAEASMRYQRLAENASDIVVQVAVDGSLRWVSPSIQHALGWNPDELVDTTPWELVHPQDREAVSEALAASSGSGVFTATDVRMRTFGGEYRWMSASGHMVEGGDLVIGLRDVDAQVRAQRRLAESEKRFRMLAENASDVVYEVGPDTFVSWISPSVTAALGWTPEELLGTTMYDLIHLDDRPRIDAARAAVLRGQKVEMPVEGFASRFRHKDGRYTWMSLKTTTIAAPDGQLAYAVTGMRDVDALVRARKEAEEAAALLRVAADSLLDPQVLLQPVRDDDGRVVDFLFVEANRAACAELRIERAHLVGRSMYKAVPDLVDAGLFDLYAESAQTGRPLSLDGYHYRSQRLGFTAYFDVRAAPAPGDRLSLTWRDVTVAREVERRIAASEEHYRLLAQNSSEVVFRSREGVILWASPALTPVLGWELDEWVGASIYDFLHPADRVIRERNTARVADGEVVRARYRLLDKSGIYRWVSTSVTRYVTADGTTVWCRPSTSPKTRWRRRPNWSDAPGWTT